MPSDVIIESHGVTKRFGGLTAVDRMSLAVERGTLTGIIGPNGAGKSTFFNLLAGFYRPDEGRIVFEGRDITRAPAYRRARHGIARTFQLTRALARMTVKENLMLAPDGQLGEHVWAPILAGPRVRAQDDDIEESAIEMLQFFELTRVQEDYAGSLSGGQKKLLELARALMRNPTLVLLDEPMAGVNPTLARKLMDKIEQLRLDRGITFILVEHDLETVFTRCDPIVVMANGSQLAKGDADEIRANQEVVDAYLGG